MKFMKKKQIKFHLTSYLKESVRKWTGSDEKMGKHQGKDKRWKNGRIGLGSPNKNSWLRHCWT